MATPEARFRYFAYARATGEVCFVPLNLHQGFESHPHTVVPYGLLGWLGFSEEMTRKEFALVAWSNCFDPDRERRKIPIDKRCQLENRAAITGKGDWR